MTEWRLINKNGRKILFINNRYKFCSAYFDNPILMGYFDTFESLNKNVLR